VERFFRDITAGRIRNGVFRSVQELTDAIDEYIALRTIRARSEISCTFDLPTYEACCVVANHQGDRTNERLSSKENEALHWQPSNREPGRFGSNAGVSLNLMLREKTCSRRLCCSPAGLGVLPIIRL